MDESIQKLHQCILVIMKEIHKICVDNNIHYTLAGGSLLGSMRHKGFIPWDDDMDIMMPWDDYKRFIDIVFAMKHEWLEFFMVGHRDSYYNFIIEAVDSRTTLIPARNETPMGVFIDIFPYVYCGNSKKDCNLQYGLFKFSDNSLLCKVNHYDVAWNIKYRLFIYHLAGRILPVKFFVKCMYMQMNYLDKKRKKYSFDPTGTIKGIVPTGIFEGGFVLAEFEGEMFYRLKRADEYLTCVFGNYMEMPPLEKQTPHHYSYINPNLPYKDYKSEQTL